MNKILGKRSKTTNSIVCMLCVHCSYKCKILLTFGLFGANDRQLSNVSTPRALGGIDVILEPLCGDNAEVFDPDKTTYTL